MYVTRVYADIVINHMTNEAAYTNYGSAGNWFNSVTMLYPHVGYSAKDFHSPEGTATLRPTLYTSQLALT